MRTTSTAERSVEQLKGEIEARLGYFPPWFSPALEAPPVLESLWQQTLAAYLGTALPRAFVEPLCAYLSKFCVDPYCVVVHSCAMRAAGFGADDILELLATPAPLNASPHIERLSQEVDRIGSWPARDSELYAAVFWCSVFAFVERGDSRCRAELKRVLGLELFCHWTALLGYVRTVHEWVESTPGLSAQGDARVRVHLAPLLAEAPTVAPLLGVDAGGPARGAREVPLRLTDRSRLADVLRNTSAGHAADSLEREGLVRQIAERIEDVFYVLDLGTGRVLYVSPAFEGVWGRRREELYADPGVWIEGVHKTDRERVAARDARFHVGEGFDEEYRVCHPDGSVRWVRERGFPVEDGGGTPYRATGSAQDVTRERELRIQLQRSQRLEAVGLLASGIAHEYNNLLMGIDGCASVALSHLGESPARAFVEEIKQASERGTSLARRLLSLHRRSSDVAQGAAELDAAGRRLEAILRRLLGVEIELRVTLNAPELRVPLSDGQIEQILLNLAINARDAMTGGGVLELSTHLADLDADEASSLGNLAAGSYGVITVRDTGCGMDAEMLSLVFEPFFSTKQVGEGTGLGLSTVHALVTSCGGHVAVESAVGVGTTFTIYVPRTRQVARAEERRTGPVAGRDAVVLVVEDEPLVLLSARHYLEANGYSVLSAGSAAEGLRICAEHTGEITLLLTDVSMPGMDGRTLAARVRAMRPDIKVLYMSAYPREQLIRRGRIDPGARALEKPFGERVLGDAVRSMIEEGR